METPTTNGNNVPATSNLVIPQQASSPAEPTSATSGPKDPSPPVTEYPEPVNLADETRRQRIERQSRQLLIAASSQMKQRVNHPDGGDSPVEDILAHETEQRAEISRDRAKGSHLHRRLPRWIRSIPKYVLAFDFGLLLYFFAGITNVDWTSPLSLALAFAIVLAAMVTLLSYGFLSFTGHRLRSHKNHAGTIHREDVDGITAAAFAIAIAVIGVLAALMLLRIRAEVLDALGAQAQLTALVIAVAVAVVNAVANFLVVAIHALDGSDASARLDKLSSAIRGPLAKAHHMREQAAQQINQPLSGSAQGPGPIGPGPSLVRAGTARSPG